MRQSRRVRNAVAATAPSVLNRTVLFLLFLIPVLLIAASAFAEPGSTNAGNFNEFAQKTGNKSSVIIDIINYISFLSGCVLAGLGISELRRLSDGTGGGSLQLRHPLGKLGFGGILMAVPYFTLVFQDTFGGDGSLFEMFKMNAYTFQGDASSVSSSGLGGLIKNGINNVMVLVDVANLAAFIIGVFFVVRGIQMLRNHIDNPGNSPIAESLKRLAVGGALLSFPVIVNVVYKTFGARGSALTSGGWSSTSGGGGAGGATLDGMFTNLIKDIANPAYAGIELFCYISGIVMVLFALQRLVRTAQDGPRGPLGFGTLTMFVVAGCLLSFPQFLAVLDFSLLGGGQALTNVSFMSDSGVDAAQLQTAKNVFSAILAFMAVIGFLSVVRGLFLLKALGDGNQQATMMSVATHLIAGSIAINLGSFINAIQTSLGVTSNPVTFGM